MPPGAAIAGGAAIGAVLVLGGLFAFQLLADKLYVTRREWEQKNKADDEWRAGLNQRLTGMETNIKDSLKLILDDLRASRSNQ